MGSRNPELEAEIAAAGSDRLLLVTALACDCRTSSLFSTLPTLKNQSYGQH
jgi:hypothetical protein